MASVPVPAALAPYIEYVTFSEGHDDLDGVELMLTKAGVEYARAGHNRGSLEMARWLIAQPLWQGDRTETDVANEISTHALYANWPLLGKRANPVNLEYFQTWPANLFLVAWDKLRRKLRQSRKG